ncbi:MAG: AAA family ATPase [Alphaproteobacteria bacterium]|nr:AAA family ATPase [Alphaproteobacteria bacterium]
MKITKVDMIIYSAFYAVEIYYNIDEIGCPKCIRKTNVDTEIQEMVVDAENNQKPIYRDDDLSKTLFNHVKEGELLSPKFFKSVAKIMVECCSNIKKFIVKNTNKSNVAKKKVEKQTKEKNNNLKKIRDVYSFLFFKEFFKLTNTQTELLAFMYLKENNEDFILENCLNFNWNYQNVKKFVPQLCNNKNLQSSLAKLEKLKIIYKSSKGYFLTKTANYILNRPDSDIREDIYFLNQPDQKPKLSLKDFYYIKNLNQTVQKIKKLSNKNPKNIKVIVEGAIKTGRKELCRIIAQKAGLKLFRRDSKAFENDFNISYKSVVFLLRNIPNAALLIENNCEIFNFPEEESTLDIPIFFVVPRNCNYDLTTCPAIVIDNHVRGRDLKKIWNINLEKYNLNYTNHQKQELAKKYYLVPETIISEIQNAKLFELTYEEFTQRLDKIYKDKKWRIHFDKKVTNKNDDFEKEYSTDLLNTDVDLAKLAEGILKTKKLNFSLCLYGAPGTGKSAYAIWLSKKLNMPYIIKRASDLINKFVGETESNIASAFTEAAERKAMLILDEADSFLQDRSFSKNSWEVTQINEMLTQMESFKYPLVCTTNLINKLDKASLRRFTFKVKYEYMTEEQKTKAFNLFFKIPNIKIDLDNLAPGDFATVKKKAEFLQITSKQELIEMLKKEVEVKGVSTKKIGFL